MLAKRIIACLDVANGKVVKGTNFKNLKYVGNAVEMAKKYNDDNADELSFLDITASYENRKTTDLIKRVAKQVFIPFSVGGGIRTIKEIEAILKSGAEKVSIGTAAVLNPRLIKLASKKFGSQAIVVSIDAKKQGNSWFVYIKGGREKTNEDVIEFARQMEGLGAGEILLNSIDADGTKKGFDIELTKKVCNAVNMPVIASGGAGKLEDFLEMFRETGADAALAASIFHYNQFSISDIKNFLNQNGVRVRC